MTAKPSEGYAVCNWFRCIEKKRNLNCSPLHIMKLLKMTLYKTLLVTPRLCHNSEIVFIVFYYCYLETITAQNVSPLSRH